MAERPLIGIAAPILARNHTRNIVRGALAQAQCCGCDVIVMAPLVSFTSCTAEHAHAERQIYDLIDAVGFDGFLYVKDDATMGNAVIAAIEERLLRSNQYVMTVDEREHPVFDSTQYDDYDDFGKVTAHLIEVHGYKKIYCLTGPKETFQAQSRLRAYQDQMTAHGLYFDETYYTYGTFWVDSAIAYAKRLLSGELAMPEAIVCGNDIMAMALIKNLLAAEIRIPEDVAVTGYDGFPFAANVDVTLTTYARNHYQLGADAVRRLYRNMTGNLCSKVHRPDSGLRLGNSCGCTAIPARQLLPDTSAAVPAMWEEEIFYDDLAYDMSLADSRRDLLQRALRHSKILYQADSLRIFLYDEADQLRLAAGCRGNGEPDGTSGLPVTTAASFLRQTETPEAVFLSPLHLHGTRFGMIALSFSAADRVYDRGYLFFVASLVTQLRRLQPFPAEEHVPSDSARSRNRTQMRRTLGQLRDSLRQSPETPWTIEMMCMESGLPKSTLQKYYKQFFGKSAFEELIGFRVEAAKRLLAETELSLGEIAVRCGYTTESYFLKQFKKVTGMTPSAYRRRIGQADE